MTRQDMYKQCRTAEERRFLEKLISAIRARDAGRDDEAKELINDGLSTSNKTDDVCFERLGSNTR